jgi:uncharacterized protein YdbL (DUF1318 family)
MVSPLKFLRTGTAMVAASLLLVAGAAQAERDPAYAAARSSGQVGEKMDGYLGIVGTPSETLKRMVDGINIKRKQVYVAEAQDEKVTVQEYAFTAGCVNIANTAAGEKYQAPNGNWKTRDADLPDRDPRCK